VKRPSYSEAEAEYRRLSPAQVHAGSDKERPPRPPAGTCPVCGGLGWVRLPWPVGHPYFGQLVECPRECGPARG